MHLDVVRLRDFYGTPLGALTADIIAARLQGFWPDLSGQIVLGIGYATPVLQRLTLDMPPPALKGSRMLAMMPATQGVHRWPSEPGSRNATLLAPDMALPFADASVDRVFLMHFIETTEEANQALREVWRVLRPGGRIVAVVPHRSGTWALTERTPFGHGRPFTRSQLANMLVAHMFSECGHAAALYCPPFTGRIALKALQTAERFAARWCWGLGGLLFMEAEKQIYALGEMATARARRKPVLAAPLTFRRDAAFTQCKGLGAKRGGNKARKVDCQ